MKNPFLKHEPDAVTTNKCGVCHEGPLVKHFECKSLDSGFAPLFICNSCSVIYNATAEFNSLDVIEWQKRWSKDPDFYNVPFGSELSRKIDDAGGVFNFFQSELGAAMRGVYVEIGAGSGIMAAAALKIFEHVYALDHVKERLLQVKERTEGLYRGTFHVADFDDLAQIRADVILIWHAMEHFIDPGSVFLFCSNILKSKGVLLIQIPVLSFEHVYPGHYYFFNETTFQRLACKHAMNVVNFYYDHFMNAMTVCLRRD